MSDERARQCVLRTLAEPEIRSINFHIGSVHVTSRLLGRVRTCVARNRIHVRHDPSLSGDEYDHGNNTLYLRFDRTTRMTQKASIVHECVHAALDLARASRMRFCSTERRPSTIS